MEYDKKTPQDYMRLHHTIAAELRNMLRAKTMESFATDEVDMFRMSSFALIKFMEGLESGSRTTFNLAAMGFQPITGRTLGFKNSKSAELSAPKNALVLPIRELRSSEKTRLTAMTFYSAARNALITGIGGSLAFKNGLNLEADRFQNLDKSTIAALLLGGSAALMYFGGKQFVKTAPQIIAATKAAQIGLAVDVPAELDMKHPQLATSLRNSYAFVY